MALFVMHLHIRIAGCLRAMLSCWDTFSYPANGHQWTIQIIHLIPTRLRTESWQIATSKKLFDSTHFNQRRRDGRFAMEESKKTPKNAKERQRMTFILNRQDHDKTRLLFHSLRCLMLTLEIPLFSNRKIPTSCLRGYVQSYTKKKKVFC